MGFVCFSQWDRRKEWITKSSIGELTIASLQRQIRDHWKTCRASTTTYQHTSTSCMSATFQITVLTKNRCHSRHTISAKINSLTLRKEKMHSTQASGKVMAPFCLDLDGNLDVPDLFSTRLSSLGASLIKWR